MKKLHTLLLVLGLSSWSFSFGKWPSQLYRQLRVLGWGLIPIVIAEGVAKCFTR